MENNNNIIAVASGKKGIGKTWLAITLAHAFAMLKQKTLFFDADLGLANISVQLGLATDNAVDDMLSGTKTLNQMISYSEKTKFDVISGRFGTIGLSSVPMGRLQVLGDDLALLASSYDLVIVDMGKGVEKEDCIFPSLAGRVVVVCTSDKESIIRAYAFIKLMIMQNTKGAVNIVVNQVNSIAEGKRTFNTLFNACQNFLNISPSFLGIIRRDTRVRDAIRSQTPMLIRYPTSEAAEDVMTIARKIIESKRDEAI